MSRPEPSGSVVADGTALGPGAVDAGGRAAGDTGGGGPIGRSRPARRCASGGWVAGRRQRPGFDHGHGRGTAGDRRHDGDPRRGGAPTGRRRQSPAAAGPFFGRGGAAAALHRGRLLARPGRSPRRGSVSGLPGGGLLAMILLWGLEADPPLREVYAALRRAGAAVRLLDQRRLLTATAELLVGDQVSATVTCDGRELDLSRCTAAYIRPFDATQLGRVRRAGPGDPLWIRAAQLDRLLLSWTELTDALVVNRPSAMASNDSKPLQAAELRACGFAVPETLVTTDPDAARAFLECHRQVIYKSISSVRSIVAELDGAALARLEAVRWCPTQFQERIPGTDYRVHVVGDEVFATRVQSDAV